MRSRLEARWACFFDYLGWRWEYEPIDLPCVDLPGARGGASGGARGWVPDFSLVVPGVQPMLVECKPALTTDQLEPAQRRAEAVAAASYGGRGWRGPVLLVGVSPDVVVGRPRAGAPWLPPPWWPVPTTLLRLGWTEAVNRTQWRGR